MRCTPHFLCPAPNQDCVCVFQGVLLEPWEEGVGQPLALPLVVPVLEVPVVSESTHPRPSTQQHSVAQQRGERSKEGRGAWIASGQTHGNVT